MGPKTAEVNTEAIQTIFSETDVYCDTDSLTKNKSKRSAEIIFKCEISFAKRIKTKMKDTCIKHDSCSV